MLKPVNYLLIITSLLIVFSCGKKAEPPVSRSMQQQISLMPQDAELLGYMNVKDLRNSDVYKTLVDSMKMNPLDPKTYLKQMNLNLENAKVDIEDIFIAYQGEASGSMAPFIVVHGDMNLAQYLGAIKIKTKDFEISEDNEFNHGKLFVITARDTFGVGFQDSSVMVLGNLDKVKSWFKKTGRNALKADNEYMARLSNLKHTETGWFLVDAASLFKNLNIIQNLQNVEGVQQIKTADISFVMGKELFMNSIITSIDAENAELVKDTLKGALASAKLSKTSDRELTDVINKINVKQIENKVEITTKLSLKEIQKLASLRR
jgi:hypothetical protein